MPVALILLNSRKRGIRGTGIKGQPKVGDLDELAKLIDAKKITPIVSEVLPLADAAKPREQVAKRHTRGKVVLKVSDAPKT